MIEVQRRVDIWTFEGAMDSAKLTAVRGEHTLVDVERVPPWLEAVLGALEVREVTLGQ
ncbi:hypothetical protein HYG81_19405 (plasmid) [Natrinema zhouii]|uniref:hypothetical protein n=1 Tax=Natrinema zhouii TaxID=1710539 RepID=UPI001CFF6C33|nr:hypothetical protein [Natrinema zhouii]UHQ98253.1 hypothetical protein HYG81_19405 [Natrinema zhouii]